MTTYVLPDELRRTLRQPLGDLVSGTEAECIRILKEAIKKEAPTKLILVGDTVSRSAVQAGISPDVMIIDNLEKRARAISYTFQPRKVIKTKNQAGRIEDEARRTVERAIHGEADLVEVDGEEDLLTIIAVLTAPSGSLVIYGQPGEGIIIVRVSSLKKQEAQSILDRMERLA